MPIATLPSISSLLESTSLVTTKVKIDSKEVLGVISIGIEKTINSIPKAYLIIDDGDVASQNFAKAEMDHIAPGKQVEILVGYNSNDNSLFEGVITKQSIRITKSGRTRLELVCKDLCFKMSLTKKSRYYDDSSDEDVISEIFNTYSDISGSYDIVSLNGSTKEKHEKVIQHNISDWDFIVGRAEQVGAYVLVENGNISIQSLPQNTVPSLSLEFGRDIYDLDLEVDVETQYTSIKAEAWNHENQEMITSESSNINIPNQGNISSDDLANVTEREVNLKHCGFVSQYQLDQWTRSKELKAKLSQLKGTITCQGSHLLELNTYINLNGMSNRFNGNSLLTGTSHSINSGNWLTTAQIGLNPIWHRDLYHESEKISDINTSNISGVYIGVVKNVHEDPKENNRLYINIPSIQPGEEGSWMRLLSYDASPDKGFINRPDVGDEVAVAFINDDIHHGVILGALFSKTNNGSDLLSPVEENNKKGWVLKPDMHLLFDTNDDIVELVTAKGNSILIDQDVIKIEDQFSNKIVLDSSGITISSDNDLVFDVKGKISLSATNIENDASASFTAKGNMTELNGSGMTTIKGNPVNIN